MKKSLHFFLLWITLVCLSSCFRNPSAENQQVSVQARIIKTTHFSSPNFNIHTLEELYQFLTYREDSYPLVSAHRGGATAVYPENAMETFQFWADQFPIIIETDVRLSKDSVLILMHDNLLDRTTTGTGSVSKYTLEELKKLRLKDSNGELTDFQIPTLEEALMWGKGNVLFTLDVKQEVPYDLVSQVIQKAHAQASVIIITYNAKQARAIYRINSDLMISASINSPKELVKLIDAGVPDNRLVAFVGTSPPSSELLLLLHSHGIKIILGTMGNLDKQARSKGYQVYAEYIDSGVDILSTDQPAEAQKALDFYIKKRKITSLFINH